ncbi:MAG: InlB B-repeat-containing protein, partial [Lachnospiraceae bacterium]|nr:InlB B-repeat-containing protein [Lachnospiraceae bacterium]
AGQGAYDQEVYDESGAGQGAYDQEVYDESGMSQGAYDQEVYDESGAGRGVYAQEGYYESGEARETYDQEGYYESEEAQETYDQENYDEVTYEQDEQEVYDEPGYEETGYEESGYEEEAYDPGYRSYDRAAGRRAAAAATAAYVGGETRTVAYSREDREAVRRASSHAAAGTGARSSQARSRRDDGFQGEITYIDDYDQKPRPARSSNASRNNKKKDDGGGFSPLDGLLAVVGIIIILGLAGFIGWFYLSHKDPEDPHSQFAGIGKQLQSIELIGGKGIAAVANAEMAKLAQVIDEPEETEAPDSSGEYDENPYANTIAVAMSLTSVQKDLKIKFSNRETSKLVGNVRFVAQITKPDGTTEEWVDSDMDGIIYEKGIDSGKYSVTIKALTDDKYNNLILPSTSQTVTVKKNIDYTKVDVSGEGKKESEINVNQEDTKKNETAVEGGLNDTVTWVASSTTGNTYTEVLKSTIPDPLTRPITVAKNFMRTAQTTDPNGQTTDPNAGTTNPNGQTTDPGTTTPEKFKISFNANGGEGSMAEVEVEAGSYTLPGCGFTAPANKEFDKWEQGAVGASITVSGNVTLTALWKDKAVTTYTVSFAANGGGGSMNSVTVEAGKNYTLPECAFTAPENKEFDKWDQGAVGASITVNGNVTLTAQWKDKAATQFKVTFAAGEGGSGTMAEVTAPAGSYTLPECTFTAPEGKKFDKWDKGKAGEKIDLTGNVTLTAQ